MKKNVSKNGLFGPRDNISRLKNKEYYPLFFVALAVIGLLVVGLFIYFVAIPMVAKDFRKDEGPVVIKDNSGSGVGIIQKENLYNSVEEHLFRMRYINQPQRTDNEFIWTGGMDSAGNPSLIKVYLDTANSKGAFDGNTLSALEIKCVNNNIFYPQLDTEYIAYVDSKNGGGGGIFYYNRKTGTTKQVKEYFGAAPEIHLSQNRIIWFEQVAGNLSSIYVYDILLDKLAAIETQVNLPFVYGGVGVYGNKVIWSDAIDTDFSAADVARSNKSQLRILDLSTGEISSYNPDMYAFAPQMYGNTIGWLDTNNSPSASLYIMTMGQVQKKLASSVTEYSIYDGVVTYCQNERMYAYFIDKDLTLPISKEDKKAMMIGGKNGYVFWYDVTQSYERDIVKYAKVVNTSWQG